jgi:CheY-like chemotaxis protein
MKVLIVDDDPDVREALRGILGTAGHGTAAAADGIEALEYLSKEGRPA